MDDTRHNKEESLTVPVALRQVPYIYYLKRRRYIIRVQMSFSKAKFYTSLFILISISGVTCGFLWYMLFTIIKTIT